MFLYKFQVFQIIKFNRTLLNRQDEQMLKQPHIL
jgi:hypothetical protein